MTNLDPRFKALKTISEKKAAFNQYIEEQKARDRNEARLRRQMVTKVFVLIFIVKGDLLAAPRRMQRASAHRAEQILPGGQADWR